MEKREYSVTVDGHETLARWNSAIRAHEQAERICVELGVDRYTLNTYRENEAASIRSQWSYLEPSNAPTEGDD